MNFGNDNTVASIRNVCSNAKKAARTEDWQCL